MTTALISFLGRTPKDTNGYRTTAYTFPDGTRTAPLAYFGWALQQRFRPQQLIILGTDGSMWDHLFEGDLALGSEGENERLALLEACAEKRVTQAQLDQLAPILAQALHCQVSLRIIPYCRNEAEQIELMRRMAEHVTERASVHLDVTHGFRHLPMLALLSALHLRIARKASVQGIWYGSYDPDTQSAPVHDLSGLLRIADGLQALASFDKDGDYSIFLPLLKQAGLAKQPLEHLSKAAYFENILNVGAATGELRKAQADLKNARLTPDAELLRPSILERIDWLNEDRQFQKQTQLAKRALERNDYLRATLYAYESVITRLCQMQRMPMENFEEREDVRKRYGERLKNTHNEEHEDYKLLKNLRNQIAHGTRGSQGDIQKILLDENKLKAELQRLLNRIEQDKLPSSEESPSA